jgi:S-adenosylmethionine/arginine decarboxylase-like enzyme
MPAAWGMLAAIDLHSCERRRLRDPNSIRVFVAGVIEAIGMRAHGPLRLDRFGSGELEGWSGMQFIETSSITVHADEFSCRCFVDVFPAASSTRRSRPRSRSPTLAVDTR